MRTYLRAASQGTLVGVRDNSEDVGSEASLRGLSSDKTTHAPTETAIIDAMEEIITPVSNSSSADTDDAEKEQEEKEEEEEEEEIEEAVDAINEDNPDLVNEEIAEEIEEGTKEQTSSVPLNEKQYWKVVKALRLENPNYLMRKGGDLPLAFHVALSFLVLTSYSSMVMSVAGPRVTAEKNDFFDFIYKHRLEAVFQDFLLCIGIAIPIWVLKIDAFGSAMNVVYILLMFIPISAITNYGFIHEDRVLLKWILYIQLCSNNIFIGMIMASIFGIMTRYFSGMNRAGYVTLVIIIQKVFTDLFFNLSREENMETISYWLMHGFPWLIVVIAIDYLLNVAYKIYFSEMYSTINYMLALHAEKVGQGSKCANICKTHNNLISFSGVVLAFWMMELLNISYLSSYSPGMSWMSALCEFFFIEAFNLLGSACIDENFPTSLRAKRKSLMFRRIIHVLSIISGAYLICLMLFYSNNYSWSTLNFCYFLARLAILNNTNGSEGQLFENNYNHGAFTYGNFLILAYILKNCYKVLLMRFEMGPVIFMPALLLVGDLLASILMYDQAEVCVEDEISPSTTRVSHF